MLSASSREIYQQCIVANEMNLKSTAVLLLPGGLQQLRDLLHPQLTYHCRFAFRSLSLAVLLIHVHCYMNWTVQPIVMLHPCWCLRGCSCRRSPLLSCTAWPSRLEAMSQGPLWYATSPSYRSPSQQRTSYSLPDMGHYQTGACNAHMFLSKLICVAEVLLVFRSG
jgi:hypothetical protein